MTDAPCDKLLEKETILENRMKVGAAKEEEGEEGGRGKEGGRKGDK